MDSCCKDWELAEKDGFFDNTNNKKSYTIMNHSLKWLSEYPLKISYCPFCGNKLRIK